MKLYYQKLLQLRVEQKLPILLTMLLSLKRSVDLKNLYLIQHLDLLEELLELVLL
jgi:hypothetical protein